MVTIKYRWYRRKPSQVSDNTFKLQFTRVFKALVLVLWSKLLSIAWLLIALYLLFSSSERQKYYKHIRKAKSQPEKYMSVIIDGMDQHCTSIPQLHPTPKALSYNDQLHTHITGALVHGRGQHAYIDFNEYPHDSNLTINILLNILVRYADSLPPVLYLQLDNTSRENKNRHLFSFLSLLLELNIFKKVMFNTCSF